MDEPTDREVGIFHSWKSPDAPWAEGQSRVCGKQGFEDVGYCKCTREPHGPEVPHACQHGGWH